MAPFQQIAYRKSEATEITPTFPVLTSSSRHLCWDLNGNRNERIVSTSLICLRRENIDPVSGGISFRTETKRNAWEDEPNGWHDSDPEVVAGPSSAPPGPSVVPDPPDSEDGEQRPSFQELGTVQLPEGRIVTYPNALQHKFEAPKLENPSKPGSLQFMQIHLVDPHYIVCTTRFVPPQSLDWWKEAIDYQSICLENDISMEISYKIIESLLVSERWLNKKKKRVRGLQSYWQTRPVSFDNDNANSKQRQLYQACQPPVRHESALRRKREALQRHERVMRAVNGPKVYSQPRAITVWVQSMLRDPGPFDNGDPRDRVSALAPESDNGMQDTDEENIADFDSPMAVATSSGSEGSTGEEEQSDDDDDDDDGGGGGGGGDDNDEGGTEQAVDAAAAQDEDAGEESDENYVDAVYAFNVRELAEIEAMERSSQDEELSGEGELESLYDDAMSHADEMELDEVEPDDMRL